jgi:hypothetical protein
MKKVHSILSTASIALAMSFSLSCSDSGGGGGDEPSSSSGTSSSSGGVLLLNFTSNYVDGELRWMPTDSTALNPGSIDFYQDSWVFANNGQIFVLERPTDTTTWVTGGALNCLSVSTATGSPVLDTTVLLPTPSNPYDIAYLNGTGYIALYGANSIQKFNLNDCGLLGAPITLPAVPIPAGADTSAGQNGIPSQNPVSIRAYGSNLYVVLQRWVKYPPDTIEAHRQPTKGILLKISPAGALLDSTTLRYVNPQTSVLDGANKKLYIGSAYDMMSSIDSTKSGIEVVNLSASSLSSDTLISGGRLGGGTAAGATSMVLGSNSVLWTIVYTSWGNATVKAISTSGGITTDLTSDITAASCLAYDSISTGRLFIGNGTGTSASLYYYDGSVNTVGNSSSPSLPPYSLAIVKY